MKPSRLRKLSSEECRHYRDELRDGRYAALADAEGFDQICFALEALGLRLLGMQGDLGKREADQLLAQMRQEMEAIQH